jgi:hypothetical protein
MVQEELLNLIKKIKNEVLSIAKFIPEFSLIQKMI